jgi:hypothetical protein
MVSIQRVYDTLKNLANKDQKGFVTPYVFNSFATLAQLRVFNEIFGELVEAKKLASAGVDAGSILSLREKKMEDMAYYTTTSEFNAQPFRIPGNTYKIISVSHENPLSLDELYAKCELITNPSTFEYIKKSRLSYPTDDYRVALIFQDRVRVYPEGSSDTYYLYYYRTPGCYSPIFSGGYAQNPSLTPLYAVDVVDGIELFSVVSSRNFDLPASYESEIINEMAAMIGLNLRDSDVVQSAQQNTSAE